MNITYEELMSRLEDRVSSVWMRMHKTCWNRMGRARRIVDKHWMTLDSTCELFKDGEVAQTFSDEMMDSSSPLLSDKGKDN